MTRRMKIAIVADTITTAVGAGAAISGQRFVDRLRQHHDVVIISSDPHGSNVKLRGIPSLFSPVILSIPNRKKIRNALADVDIVHLQFPFWLSFAALDEARKAGKPVVASFHVQPENIFYNLGIRWHWVSHKLYQFWVKKLWNRANLVVCPSRFAQQKLLKYDLQTPSVVISNGVPSDDMQEIISPRKFSHDGKFLITMIGRLSPEKRQETLITAVSRSRYANRIKLMIAGMGHYKNKLSRLAKKLPNGATIGYISNEEKQQVLATANLFVHCSEVELEGMAVLEAMNAGLPVLIAEGPETAAADFALENFRFPVGDADALAAKIDWLIEHPEELTKASTLYRQAACELSIEKSIASIEDEFRKLCN